MQSLRTVVRMDLGSVVHVICGHLAVLFRQEWLLTVIFLVKQILDVFDGEDVAETSGDIAEFVFGMMIGWTVQLLIALRR